MLKTVIGIILVIGLLIRVVCGVLRRPVIGECGVILMWTAVLTGSWELPMFGYGISKGVNAGLVVSLFGPTYVYRHSFVQDCDLKRLGKIILGTEKDF